MGVGFFTQVSGFTSSGSLAPLLALQGLSVKCAHNCRPVVKYYARIYPPRPRVSSCRMCTQARYCTILSKS